MCLHGPPSPPRFGPHFHWHCHSQLCCACPEKQEQQDEKMKKDLQ